MRDQNLKFRLTALAAAMFMVYGPTQAAQVDDLASQTFIESTISVGIGHQGGERQQFGMFDGLMDDETVLLLDADIKTRDDATGTWKTLSVTNLGLDNREIKAGMERQGNWGIGIGYNQIVRDAPYIVNTYWQGIGTNQLVRSETQGTNAFAGLGTDYRMGTERDILSLDFFKYLSPNWNVKVSFKNEEKEGTRHWGRGNPSNEFAVEPIDYTTRQLEATFNFLGEKLQFSGGYYGSWFENANNLVCERTSSVSCIDTGTFTSSTSNPTFLSVPLDNQAHQIFLNGAYSFTPTMKGTFRAAYTHATMDESLPHASITNLSLAGAPSKLEGEINTTLVQAGLSARPLPKLSLLANLRYQDVKDETPVAQFINSGGTTVSNTPYSYETLSGKVEGTYSLAMGYSLIAGLDYSNQDRSVPVGRLVAGIDQERFVPFRTDLDETTYRLQVRKSLSETLNGSLAYLHSARDGSTYTTAAAAAGGGAAIQDLIAPIHIADRDRDKWRLTVDWLPSEVLNLQANYEHAKDDYTGRDRGLLDGKAWLFSLDATYVIKKDWQLTAWYSHDYTEANQLNGAAVAPNRPAKLKDTGDSVGLGVQGQVNPKLKIGADLQWIRTHSEYELTTLEDIKNRSTRLKLFADYALKKNADLNFEVIHERWKTDDWTWLFSNDTPYVYGSNAANSDSTMVITDPKQNATFVGIRYKYKFH